MSYQQATSVAIFFGKSSVCTYKDGLQVAYQFRG